MTTSLARNLPWLAMLLAGTLLGPQQARAADCVIEIALGSGNDNYVYNTSSSTRQIGYWDVDSGGAQVAGSELGSHYINLSLIDGPMTSQECIEDIRLVGGAWGEQRNAPMGYTEAGWWDVDSGGSADSNNNSTDGRMTLFVKKMAKTSEPAGVLQVIEKIGLRITDGKPGGFTGATQNGVSGYTRVGWWDVDSDPGCGFAETIKTCGTYGAELMVKKVPYKSGEEIKTLVLTGRWEVVNTCRGSKCGETSFQLTVGAEAGKEISRSSTLGKSLGMMIGTEASADMGALPGGSVTAKVEVTGEISSEQEDAIMNSFTSSRESTNAVTCSGEAAMWQWKSNLQVTRAARVEDIAADSLLTVCAPIGVKPSHGNDISWDPEPPSAAPAVPTGAARFPVSGGFDFPRGQSVYSSSGKHIATFIADGNFVVTGLDHSYVWGLDQVIRDKLGRVARVTFQADGNLVVYDADGGYLWSALHAAQPAGTTLRVNDNGALQIVRPDSSVAWEAGR